MSVFDGSIWERNDRLPVPHDDPTLEWLTDLLLEADDEETDHV